MYGAKSYLQLLKFLAIRLDPLPINLFGLCGQKNYGQRSCEISQIVDCPLLDGAMGE